MAVSEVAGLALVGTAAVLAPLVATFTGRLAVPGVILEIAAGVLIGPEVLHWVSPTGIVVPLANFGLALLMFLAGFECDPACWWSAACRTFWFTGISSSDSGAHWPSSGPPRYPWSSSPPPWA